MVLVHNKYCDYPHGKLQEKKNKYLNTQRVIYSCLTEIESYYFGKTTGEPCANSGFPCQEL